MDLSITSDLPSPPILNNQFSYPVLDRQTRPDGVRHYVCPDGRAVPSVTTILSATADKAFLKNWEARVGAAKAEQARNEGTAIGSLMHENLECYLEQRERPRGNNLIRQMTRRMADVIIRRGLTQVDEVWGVESPLYFPELFAGTSDLIGVHQGEPAIIDFKNAKKMRTRDMITDYFSQGAAYAMSHNYLFDTNIKRVVIFMVTRDMQFETFICEGDEFNRACDDFQARVIRYENQMAAA